MGKINVTGGGGIKLEKNVENFTVATGASIKKGDYVKLDDAYAYDSDFRKKLIEGEIDLGIADELSRYYIVIDDDRFIATNVTYDKWYFINIEDEDNITYTVLEQSTAMGTAINNIAISPDKTKIVIYKANTSTNYVDFLALEIVGDALEVVLYKENARSLSDISAGGVTFINDTEFIISVINPNTDALYAMKCIYTGTTISYGGLVLLYDDSNAVAIYGIARAKTGTRSFMILFRGYSIDEYRVNLYNTTLGSTTINTTPVQELSLTDYSNACSSAYTQNKDFILYYLESDLQENMDYFTLTADDSTIVKDSFALPAGEIDPEYFFLDTKDNIGCFYSDYDNMYENYINVGKVNDSGNSIYISNKMISGNVSYIKFILIDHYLVYARSTVYLTETVISIDIIDILTREIVGTTFINNGNIADFTHTMNRWLGASLNSHLIILLDSVASSSVIPYHKLIDSYDGVALTSGEDGEIIEVARIA